MFGLRPEGGGACCGCWACAFCGRSTVLMAVAAAIDVPANRILRRLSALRSACFTVSLACPLSLVSPGISIPFQCEDLLLFHRGRPPHAPESEVAGRRIHRLRMARRGAISAAIIRRAEMRPAFDDLARDF